jgi:WD40 repeat protein
MSSHEAAITAAAAHVYLSVQFSPIAPAFPHEHGVPSVLRSSPLTITPSSIFVSAHTSAVLSLALAPKGRSFAFASKDGHTRIWDDLSGGCRQLLDGHQHYVYAVAYSPDGLNLATGSGDKTIVVRRLDNGTKDKILGGHSDRVSAVAFSPDGTMIVSGSWDLSVRMWQVATGHSVWTKIDHSSYVMCTAFSPDGNTVASASLDASIRLWDAKTGDFDGQQVRYHHRGAVYGVVWSPDGSRLASCSRDRTIALWSRHRKGPPLVTMTHKYGVTSMAWVPGSEDIISVSALGEDRSVRRWSSATGQLLATYAGSSSPILSIAVFPDGRTFVSGCADGSVRVWDTQTETQTMQLEYMINSEPRRISFVRKSPNGTMFAACTADGHVEVVDATSGKRLGAFRTSTDPISLSFKEDGTILTAAYSKGGRDDWSAGRDFKVPLSPATTPRADISFSADAQGWIFVSYDGRTAPRRLFLAPKDLRWLDWSSQAASVGAVLAFGSDSGVLTVMDFTPALTEAT